MAFRLFGVISIIAALIWIIAGRNFYSLVGNKDEYRMLFEIITSCVAAIFICIVAYYFFGDYKLLGARASMIIINIVSVIFVWNLYDEIVLIMGRGDISIMNNIWIKLFSGVIVLMIIGLIKEKKPQPQ